MLKQLLHTPHPFIFEKSSVIIASLLTFLVMFFLAPFDIHKLSLLHRIGQGLLSALIVAICIILVVFALKRFFPKWSKEETWNIGKEIGLFLIVVASISFIHFLFYWGIKMEENVLQLFQTTVFRTLIISIFPIIGIVLFEQFNHRNKQLKRAIELNKILRTEYAAKKKVEPVSSINEDQLIWFKNEVDKPICQLNPQSIQFIKSDGNYYEIYYRSENDAIKKCLIRNKLSAVEKELDGFSFVRVHRSYVVNTNQIDRVVGNARDLQLHMKISEEVVPVSRSKASEFLQARK